MTRKLLTQVFMVLAGFLILSQAMQAMEIGKPVTNWSEMVTNYGPDAEGNYSDEHLAIAGTNITILSARGLAWLAKETNKGSQGAFNQFTGYTITLGDDINLLAETNGGDELEWTPIGNFSNRFKGHFDGAGHTISGVYINTTNAYCGLFGFVADNRIENLHVVVSEKGITDTQSNVGGIAGVTDNSEIYNCSVSGGVISGKGAVGGLIGSASYKSKIIRCSSSAKVKGNNHQISGLIGLNMGSIAIQCYATGSVTQQDVIAFPGPIGGLIGQIDATNEGNSVKLSFSTGSLSAQDVGKGGLIGDYYKYKTTYAPTYTDCYFDQESTGCDNAESGYYDGEPLPGITGIATTQEMQSIAFANRLNLDAYNYNQTNPDIKAVGWIYRSEDYPAFTSFPPVALVEKESEGVYNENGYVEVVDVEGETLTFKIIPQEGYQLKGDVKIGEDTLTPKSGVYTYEGMDEKGVLVNASFELIPDTPVITGYHTLTLDVAPAIDLYNLAAGNHSVEEGGHLHLQFLPADRTATADNILFLVDGIETPFKDFGSGNYFSYILNPVTADHTILVAMREYTVTLPDTEGVTFDIAPGEHAVAYGERFTFSLTLAEGIDPTAVHVYANGTEILPNGPNGPTNLPQGEALRSEAFPISSPFGGGREGALTYTIDKVTGPITVQIEGTDNPTGNTRLTDTRIYCAGGQLVIETTAAQTAQVYSLAGSLVANRPVNGRETINLQPGVYIVRIKDVIQKVVVH